MTAFDFGPQLGKGETTFRIWAPAARNVELLADEARLMQPQADGWHTLSVPGAGAGTLYRYRVDGTELPDPASQFQPHDISRPSEVIDHSAFSWNTRNWRGRPWHEAVLYEAHVGTFTSEGTYTAMIDKLDHLVALGITALELMPLADFAGRRNWGYDGVLLYAPDSAYGRPEDLKRLIDEAHRRGLMMFLDVVYNHFGPEGNYLGAYAPQFFCKAQTPWGSAIDYRVAQVRDFAIQNALHWLINYRFDGLRLDAVHAITEPGQPHLLNELSAHVGELAAASGRHIHLVLENDDNRSSLLAPQEDPPHGRYRAQWNDDFHHAWHTLLTGERHGYYIDYPASSPEHVQRTLASGFAYQGEVSVHRDGRNRGENSIHLSPLAFVNFLQNHDQIGNRALGERLDSLTKPEKIEAALAIMLLAPQIPMLFMGEEWGSKRPFPFFCDFHGKLAEAVRRGRRNEFKDSYAKGENIPDPLDEATFELAKLDWPGAHDTGKMKRIELVQNLLALRQREIVPHLREAAFLEADADSQRLSLSWQLADKRLQLDANLSCAPIASPRRTGRTIWGASEDNLAPWSAVWTVD